MSIDYNSKTFEEKEEFWKERDVDGIVNEDLYWSTKPRILVIAHEPYMRKKDGDPLQFNQISSIKKYGGNPKGKTTLSLSAEMVSGIFGVDSKEGVLSKVAWINVKKQPRLGSSNEVSPEVEEAHGMNQDFIFKQIEACNPDIILAYNVFDGDIGLWDFWEEKRHRQLKYLVPDNPDGVEEIKSSYMDPYVERGVDENGNARDILVIDTCHPTARPPIYIPSNAIVNVAHCFLSKKYTLGDEWINRRVRLKMGLIDFKK